MIGPRAAVASNRVSRDFGDAAQSSSAHLLPTIPERDDESVSTLIFWPPPTFWENFRQTFCCCCCAYNYAHSEESFAHEEDTRTVHVSIFDPTSTFDLPPTSTPIEIPSTSGDEIVESSGSFQEVSLGNAECSPPHHEDELDRLISSFRPTQPTP
ncbi:hypothetical protein PMAYCL1PPCAC_33308 [Pristionchus mayeri]|uniref:Uncharacterized protein n=1 Tax=Pristionchus mayeri TaxID=1317129 RepID=A0AAN5DGZ9_9BILA|nr:hypothetical protein PMAYCL1PPCAC_33308 [Pristionchus mayeri]